jgi:transcriptional regulator with XRE-family HTH domain
MATGSKFRQGVVSVSTEIGERLAALRAARDLPLRDLAVHTGVAYSDLLALENGAGRRRTGSDTLRRLADFFCTSLAYLQDGAEPSPATLRSGFFRYYDNLGSEARERLKYAPIQSRLEAAVHYLEQAYPTLLHRSQIAARLGYSPEALDDVLRGTATLQSPVLKRLAVLIGLDVAFFVRGDFFGGVVEGEQEMSPARLAAYYQVVQEAIASGISPGALRKAVQILAIREQEE